MSFRTKIKLFILLTVCMTACLIAGCKVGGISKDEFLNKYGVAGQYVTYDANGGSFNGQASRKQMDVYFRPDAYIISSSQTNFVVERKFFNFDAWYYVDTDADGKPVLDEDGEYVYGKQVEPEDVIEGGSHLYVAAKWIPIIAIDVYLVTDDGNSVKDGYGKEYNSGDMLTTLNFGSADKPFALTQRQAIYATDATYLSFFEDAECTTPVSLVYMPVSDSEDGEQSKEVENVKVYVKYLRGEWNVVSSATDVSGMFKNLSTSKNYYLFSADGSGVIDCANLGGANSVALNTGSFNINLQGNGVTIKNLNVAVRDQNGNELSITTSANSYSLFGVLTAASQINNVKFENLTVTAKANAARPIFINLYLFNHGIESGAKIDGLVLENITYTITSAANVSIENIPSEGAGYNGENWLFCGSGTDDKFIADYGVTVTGASLTINDTAVV